MKKQNYTTVIDYLFNLLPMYQRSGKKAFKKDLTNIKRLCRALDDPQAQYPCVHIAGTNGKGTVSHLTAAVLQSMGYRVGLYTSPHYFDFRERIKISGEWITESFIIEWVNDHQTLIESIQPSFFEVTVALAFDYFYDQKVDVAVIETGLGGRLDSTNIIDPILSIITHISLDHQSMLGDSTYKISKEKAGIIKAETPVVIGRHQVSCDQVFMKKANEQKASLSWASLNWEHQSALSNSILFLKEDRSISIEWNPLESPFLLENIVTTLEAIDILCKTNSFDWDEDMISKGLNQYRSLTKYIGRWQILGKQPLMIADSAHNEDAIIQVLQRIDLLSAKNKHFVIGFVRDKDLHKILRHFPKTARYYFVNAQVARSIPSQELKEVALEYGLKGQCYPNVISGIDAATETSNKEDFIYIGGSSFVVGDALAAEGQ